MRKQVANKRAEPEKFSFCVGRPWSNPNDGICIYAHGVQVYHGTMADARAYRKYVNQQTREQNFIYKLVQVQE